RGEAKLVQLLGRRFQNVDLVGRERVAGLLVPVAAAHGVEEEAGFLAAAAPVGAFFLFFAPHGAGLAARAARGVAARAEAAARDARGAGARAHRELARGRARHAAALQPRGFHGVGAADDAVAAEETPARALRIVGWTVEIAGRVLAVLHRLAERRVFPVLQA